MEQPAPADDSASSQIDSLFVFNTEQKKLLDKANKSLHELRSDHNRLLLETDDLKSTLNHKASATKWLQSANDRLTNEKGSLEAEKESLASDNRILTKENADLKNEVVNAETLSRSLQEKVNEGAKTITRLQKALDEANSRFDSISGFRAKFNGLSDADFIRMFGELGAAFVACQPRTTQDESEELTAPIRSQREESVAASNESSEADSDMVGVEEPENRSPSNSPLVDETFEDSIADEHLQPEEVDNNDDHPADKPSDGTAPIAPTEAAVDTTGRNEIAQPNDQIEKDCNLMDEFFYNASADSSEDDPAAETAVPQAHTTPSAPSRGAVIPFITDEHLEPEVIDISDDQPADKPSDKVASTTPPTEAAVESPRRNENAQSGEQTERVIAPIPVDCSRTSTPLQGTLKRPPSKDRSVEPSPKRNNYLAMSDDEFFTLWAAKINYFDVSMTEKKLMEMEDGKRIDLIKELVACKHCPKKLLTNLDGFEKNHIKRARKKGHPKDYVFDTYDWGHVMAEE